MILRYHCYFEIKYLDLYIVIESIILKRIFYKAVNNLLSLIALQKGKIIGLFSLFITLPINVLYFNMSFKILLNIVKGVP